MTGPEFGQTLDAVAQSHARVLASVEPLTETDMRSPSLLPGWSRGHVLTHLARSADAMHRLISGIRRGSTDPMYPGGPDARAAAIEEGAGRPKALLLADLEFAGSRLLAALVELTEADRRTTVAWRRPVTADLLPQLRWRELEIHHLDLSVGYGADDWPDDFVRACLATELPLLADRAPGVAIPEISESQLLSWLIGRSIDPNLPDLPPWL